jgi:hypothetical protein
MPQVFCVSAHSGLCRAADLGYKIVLSMKEDSLSGETSAPYEPPVLIAEWGSCVYEPVQTVHKATYLNWEVSAYVAHLRALLLCALGFLRGSCLVVCCFSMT